MGLFVAADGSFQSWFSVLLCCLVAVDQDEFSGHLEKNKSSTVKPGICTEQPLPLAELPATPVPFPTADEHPRQYARNTSRVSERPPSIQPLDLGEESWNPRWSLIGRPKTSPGHIKKSSIGAPFAFRKIENAEPQRQSLVPLRLGPVVLKESSHTGPAQPSTCIVAPEHNISRSESTEKLIESTEQPQSYLSQRETPFQRCQQRSSTVWPIPPPPIARQESQERYGTLHKEPSSQTVSTRSSSSSLRHTASKDVHTVPVTSSKTSSERLRPKRKRSLQSTRRIAMEPEQSEVEKEVMELNTIVEERRADAIRSGTPDQHVAAIAPSMRVRARAETLDAIGSAFSRPLTAQSHRLAMAEDPPQPVLRRSTSATIRTSSRVSGWLSGILTSNSTSHLPANEPFYKCQMPARPLQKARSDASIRTALTEMESPSLTAASSPTTKHSRSHTGDSHITPISPATTFYGNGDAEGWKAREDIWPVPATPTSQVGLAF